MDSDRGPPLEVVTVPLLTKLSPLKVIPAMAFVLTAPLNVKAPVQVKLREAALRTAVVILVAELMITAPRRAVPPAAPEKRIFPVPAVKVRAPGPSNVLENVMGADAAAVDIDVAPASATAPAKETELPAVVELFRLTAPLPDWVKLPLSVRVAPDPNVSSPLLAIASAPPFVVETVLLKVKAVPVRLIPETLVVERAPLKIVVPAPDNCARVAALIALAVALLALAIVKALNGWTAPTAPVKVTFPAPATRVRLRVLSASPLRVLLNVMAAPPVVSVELEAVSLTTATGNIIELPDVVILPPRKIVPVEEKLTAFDTIFP